GGGGGGGVGRGEGIGGGQRRRLVGGEPHVLRAARARPRRGQDPGRLGRVHVVEAPDRALGRLAPAAVAHRTRQRDRRRLRKAVGRNVPFLERAQPLRYAVRAHEARQHRLGGRAPR